MNRLLYGSPHPREIEVERVECPLCGGKGGSWWALNVDTNVCVEVNETTYRLLPKNEKGLKDGEHYIQCEFEKCERCEGTGEIEQRIYRSRKGKRLN
jgi:RecJ-like exonuclease